MTVSRFRTIIYIVAAIVSLAGLADATYLTVQALTGETLGCGGSADCFKVLGSAYARVAGIPVASFGVLAYFSVFTFATFAVFGYARARIFLVLAVGAMFLEKIGGKESSLRKRCIDAGSRVTLAENEPIAIRTIGVRWIHAKNAAIEDSDDVGHGQD